MINFFWSYQQVQSAFTPIKYGALYNWYAAVDSRKITSSDDWVVPSQSQYNILWTLLGGSLFCSDKVRETGTTYWNTEGGATNETGFNLRGAGNRNGGTGSFDESIKILTRLSTTTTSGDSYLVYTTSGGSEAMGAGYNFKKMGVSIRLLYVGSGTPTEYVGNDGKRYPVVLIGTQYWVSMNLAETKFRNGDWIPGYDGGVYTPFTNAAWAALTTAGMCVYNDDLSNL
jgi:uncharacterized protein (TIGR02145 family)